MNILPSAAAASIAGTDRAASRGGDADGKRAEATRQQSVTEAPGGKPADSSAVDSGEQTSDRGGDGRQVLDTFEGSKGSEDDEQQDHTPDKKPLSSETQGNHLDLEA